MSPTADLWRGQSDEEAREAIAALGRADLLVVDLVAALGRFYEETLVATVAMQALSEAIAQDAASWVVSVWARLAPVRHHSGRVRTWKAQARALDRRHHPGRHRRPRW